MLRIWYSIIEFTCGELLCVSSQPKLKWWCSIGSLELVGGDYQFSLCWDDNYTATDGWEAQYILMFTDIMSWITWLKLKSEVLTKFREFKVIVENQTQKWIKILRSNQGTEYESREIVSEYQQIGIINNPKAAYNLNQNVVADGNAKGQGQRCVMSRRVTGLNTR